MASPYDRTVRVRAKGQITIPKWVRTELNIQVGDWLDVEGNPLTGEIVLRPCSTLPEGADPDVR